MAGNSAMPCFATVLETLPQPFTRFQYAGRIIPHDSRPVDTHPAWSAGAECEWRVAIKSATIRIAYRTDLPTLEEAQAERTAMPPRK